MPLLKCVKNSVENQIITQNKAIIGENWTYDAKTPEKRQFFTYKLEKTHFRHKFELLSCAFSHNI